MNKWLVSIGKQVADLSYLNRDLMNLIYRQGTIDINSTSFYLFLGDLHGNIKASIILAIRLQFLFNIPLQAVFQVGDFGFWPSGIIAKNEDKHYKKGDSLDLYEIQNSAYYRDFFILGIEEIDTLSAPIYFIRGNHEDFHNLNLLSQNKPSEVVPGIYFIPDCFQGVIENLHLLALGGIITDLDRGKGKKAKVEFKKSQQKLMVDPRLSSGALFLGLPTKTTTTDIVITHSGLASREDRDGSKQLESYLYNSAIPLHFYGHHHRFSLGNVGKNTFSIGLRNLEFVSCG
ncbi:metallophosphoesterase [Mastigocoleus testarum]|uniref:Calcineurin-like phosphoesterase domain-containing protein n=1 Tax=Mastigocoleus testarum BC008 TaxID=371196 RepID=A0A0V8A118_9CYAN|nr:metallophosphoesterase [Mastigocoleus testarum]KST70407.1 hypothetical protein BC008_45275 [Mastigocoleus testarum BC008]